LTAGHCIDGQAIGGTLSMTNALDGVSNSVSVTVANAIMHPSRTNIMLNPNTDPAVEGHSYYDAAIIDVNQDTPQFTQSPVNGIAFGDGFGGNLVGYGCDSQNPTHAGKKQRAAYNALSRAAFQTAIGQTTEYTRDVYGHDVIFGNSSGLALCPGDSGGPTFRNSNAAVAAINSSFSGTSTITLSFAASTGNIRLWIANPVQNVFQDGSGGFLLNAMAAKCITSGVPTAGLSTAAFSGICSAPSQDTDVQFWKLSTQSSGFFSIVNGNTSQCLTAAFSHSDVNAPGFAVVNTCNGSLSQGWKFTRVNPGAAQAYYSVENRGTPGTCLETSKPGDLGDINMSPCADKPAQRWIFTQ
jgi:hypothetical protein